MNENSEVQSVQSDATNGGSTLVWRNVNVFVKDKRRRGNDRLKQIISNSTGSIEPGTLMAVMGASGAGKSTLMSALAYRNMNETVVKGEILVNNRPIGPFMHRLSGFIHQDDLFDGTLTVLEHLTFVANLKLDKRMSRQEKSALVRSTLSKVSLLDCCNTRIGDTMKGKTISGGEKKRLSFAAELLTNPVLLFLDEPTTGLDAYCAQQLVQTLLSLATEQGTTIMCTIHQPSSKLFAMFHKVLFLTEGRISYIGSPDEAVAFFAQNGHHCPKTYNPADFIIGILSRTTSESDGKSTATQLCDAFQASRDDKALAIPTNAAIAEEDPKFIRKKPFWICTVYWLLQRNWLIATRDPAIQSLRMFQKLTISIIVGLCFYGTAQINQTGIQSVQGALFTVIAENFFTPMYSAITVFPRRDPLFMRERQAGLYDTFQYYLTTVLALIPGLIVEPIIFTAIFYFLAGLKPTFYAFAMTAVVSVIVMNISMACGFFFSIAFKSVSMTIAVLVPFDVALMVTSGIFMKLSSIPFVLSWLKYISWLKYANEAITIIQWEGVTNITCNLDAPICLRTAQDIFDQYDFSEDNFSIDFYALFILYIVFNVFAFLILWLRVRKN